MGNSRRPVHAFNLMNRQMVLDHLRLAVEHVAAGEKTIARQREVIAELERGGHNTKEARATLTQFLELQALHEADRKRLLQELAEYDTRPPSAFT